MLIVNSDILRSFLALALHKNWQQQCRMFQSVDLCQLNEEKVNMQDPCFVLLLFFDYLLYYKGVSRSQTLT